MDAKVRETDASLRRLRIAHLAKQRIADLSGGEKQRVALARALVNNPEVLLMDEPFNQVDASFRETLQRDIRSIVEETGLTVVLVSHDPAEVLAMRSEEHTSELQSLMRISYAVFCLKKKKSLPPITNQTHYN